MFINYDMGDRQIRRGRSHFKSITVRGSLFKGIDYLGYSKIFNNLSSSWQNVVQIHNLPTPNLNNPILYKLGVTGRGHFFGGFWHSVVAFFRVLPKGGCLFRVLSQPIHRSPQIVINEWSLIQIMIDEPYDHDLWFVHFVWGVVCSLALSAEYDWIPPEVTKRSINTKSQSWSTCNSEP